MTSGYRRSREHRGSADATAAVDLDALTGDVAGALAAQPQHDVGHVGGLADPAERRRWRRASRRSSSDRSPVNARARRTPMSVSTRPGATTLTWMPLRRLLLGQRRRASASSAALPMLYGAPLAAIVAVATDEIITMSPRGRVAHRRQHEPGEVVGADGVGGQQPGHLARVGVGDGVAPRRDAGVGHEHVDVAEVGEHGRRPSPRRPRRRRPTRRRPWPTPPAALDRGDRVAPRRRRRVR